MASIRSGTITFGLVAIPVRVYVATHSEQLAFNLLHQGCGRASASSSAGRASGNRYTARSARGRSSAGSS